MNGYDDISHIYANISLVGSFILNMNRSINVSTALYECAFNLSPEGVVNLRASDIGGITAYVSVNFTYSYAPPLNFTVYDFSEGAGEDKWINALDFRLMSAMCHQLSSHHRNIHA